MKKNRFVMLIAVLVLSICLTMAFGITAYADGEETVSETVAASVIEEVAAAAENAEQNTPASDATSEIIPEEVLPVGQDGNSESGTVEDESLNQPEIVEPAQEPEVTVEEEPVIQESENPAEENANPVITADFTGKDGAVCSIELGGSVDLSELIANLGYEGEIESFVSSNPEALDLNEEGKLVFKSAFGDETIKVVINGAEVEIPVHDPSWKIDSKGTTITVTESGSYPYYYSKDYNYILNIAEKLVYDGTNKVSIKLPNNPPTNIISYVVKYTKDGKNATEAKDAGEYTVELTVTVQTGWYDDPRNRILSQTVSKTFTITPKELTVYGTTVSDKVYDGNTNAKASTSRSQLQGGVIWGDSVQIDTATATFDSKDAGQNKEVTVTYTLKGRDAANYTVKDSTLKANINKAQLYVTGTTVESTREYNGTREANLTNKGTLQGIIGTEDVSLDSVTATYGNKNVGKAKTITVVYTIKGADKDNYIAPVNNTSLRADITAKQLTVTGTTVESTREYNGTKAAKVTNNGTLEGFVLGDRVALGTPTATYSDENVGTGKQIKVVYNITGSDAGNYKKPEDNTSFTADITPKELTVSGTTVADMIYGSEYAPEVVNKGNLNWWDIVERDRYFVSIDSATATLIENPEDIEPGYTPVKVTYTLTGNRASNYTVKDSTVNALIYVAEIETPYGPAHYASVQDAVDAALDWWPTTITMVADSTEDSVESHEDKNITLDLNGNTLTAYVVVGKGDVLTLTDGSEEQTGKLVGDVLVKAQQPFKPAGEFNMNGGTVEGDIDNNGTSEITGGSVTGTVTQNGELTVGGSADINNLYLPAGRTVSVKDPVDGMSVGVTTKNEPTDGSPVDITGEGCEDYIDNFHSNNEDFIIAVGPAGQLQVSVKPAPSKQVGYALVYVDNELLTLGRDYNWVNGRVVFTAEYLKTLSEGNHVLRIEFPESIVTENFSYTAGTVVPELKSNSYLPQP